MLLDRYTRDRSELYHGLARFSWWIGLAGISRYGDFGGFRHGIPIRSQQLYSCFDSFFFCLLVLCTQARFVFGQNFSTVTSAFADIRIASMPTLGDMAAVITEHTAHTVNE